MTTMLFLVSVLLAVTVAIRSTWSPCGVSMLSTLTPMSERARGHRYWVTCLWYIVGGTAGGLALGTLVALPAMLVSALSPSSGATALVVTVVALAALATDLRLTPVRLPGHTRQVNEVWITAYRQWVYAAGFGVQIGFGFATVFMTGALYLMVVVWTVTGPAAAVLCGGLFGLVRGSAIVAGRHLDTPARLRAFHRRFEALAPASIALVVAAEVLTIVLVGAAAGRWVAGAALAGGALVWFAVQHAARSRAGAPAPLALPIAVSRVPPG